MDFSLNTKEGFTPVDKRQHTLQSFLSRDIVSSLVNQRSNYHGLKRLSFHLSFILLSQFLVWYTSNIYQNIVCYWVSCIFYGYVISFLFHGMHECCHQTAFASVTLNKIVANIFGFACFMPPLHYTFYHWAHHRHTGNIKKDPELGGAFFALDISRSLFNYVISLSGVPFCIARIKTLVKHSTVFLFDVSIKWEYYLKLNNRRLTVTKEAFIFMLLYLLLFVLFLMTNQIYVLWQYWLKPSIIGQIFLSAYLLAEHRGCRTNETNMWLNTRSTNTYWLHYMLAWNMPWHLEHHAFPDIPFYLLPKVRKLIIQHLKQKEQNEQNEQKENYNIKDPLLFYKKSGCNPDGSRGYLSVHRQIIRDVFK